MSVAQVKQLSTESLETFDHDYVTDASFDAICRCIDGAFPYEPFTFLDVGGGAGFFADRLLNRYPQAQGVVLDNSPLLLSKNRAQARKKLIEGSGTDLDGVLGSARYDIIFLNFVLHHLIGDGYNASRDLQKSTLSATARHLNPDGRLSVCEIAYNGKPFDNLPSRLAYELTSSKALAPFVRRLGANTAGCGICFQSARAWEWDFREVGFVPQAISAESAPRRTLLARLRLSALGACDVRNVHFWLQSPL